MDKEVQTWVTRAREAESKGEKVFFSYLCCPRGHYTPKGVNCPEHGRKKFDIEDMLKAHGLEETKAVFNWNTGVGNES